jgi:hypothetical protein
MYFAPQQWWLVQYRCLYREHWYDDGEYPSLEPAVARAWQLAAQGRTVRVLDPQGRVVYVCSG